MGQWAAFAQSVKNASAPYRDPVPKTESETPMPSWDGAKDFADNLAREYEAAGRTHPAEFVRQQQAEIERLRLAVKEIDQLSLVIEAAVRHADPVNSSVVDAALKGLNQ